MTMASAAARFFIYAINAQRQRLSKYVLLIVVLRYAWSQRLCDTNCI